MKILYTITKSTVGGAQTHISQLTSSLLSQDHNIAVCAHPGGWLEDDIKSKGAKFYPNKSLKNSYNPLTLIKAVQTTKKAIKDFQPDIISCHSSFAGLVGRIAAKNFDCKVLFTAHGWGFHPSAPFLRKNIIKISEKLAAKYTDQIICVSEYDKQLATKHNITKEDKLSVIHNGTEIPDIDFSQYPIEDKINLVFIGRLSKQKDPALLLRSIADLKDGLKNKIDLKLIGNGPDKSKIEKLIQKERLESNVSMIGDISREKVFEHLKKSHIFTLISNWEGFPRSILEAMSCGLCVVATDIAGVSEAVSKDCGILVNKGDKEDIKQALSKLLTNPDLIEKKGRNARKRAEDNFSIEKTIEETKRIYSVLS